METGNVNILFGKVVDIVDELKIHRCRVSIDGLSSKIKTDELPWYFPWYGVNYLVQLNDVVPVIVFDENMSTCFYGKKIDLIDKSLGDDYEHYLELFLRTIDDKTVSLTYKKSTGIEFINGDGKILVALDKVALFSKSNSITITEDKISIGNNAEELALLGDKTVKELHAIIKHQSNMLTEIITVFTQIASVCTTPFTIPIASSIAASIPKMLTKLVQENSKIDLDADKIQSKKTYIE